MPHYRNSKIVIRVTEPIDALDVGITYPVAVEDENGKVILVLHYSDEASADACGDALSKIGAGLVGLTANPFV
jgi:hypothetical protein